VLLAVSNHSATRCLRSLSLELDRIGNGELAPFIGLVGQLESLKLRCDFVPDINTLNSLLAMLGLSTLRELAIIIGDRNDFIDLGECPAFIPPTLKDLTITNAGASLIEALPDILATTRAPIESLRLASMKIHTLAFCSLTEMLLFCSSRLKRCQLSGVIPSPASSTRKALTDALASAHMVMEELEIPGLLADCLDLPTGVGGGLPVWPRLCVLSLDVRGRLDGEGLCGAWASLARGSLPALVELRLGGVELEWSSATAKAKAKAKGGSGSGSATSASASARVVRETLGAALRGVAGSLRRLSVRAVLKDKDKDKGPGEAATSMVWREVGLAVGSLGRLQALELELARSGLAYQALAKAMMQTATDRGDAESPWPCPLLWRVDVLGVTTEVMALADSASEGVLLGVLPSVRVLRVRLDNPGPDPTAVQREALLLWSGLAAHKHHRRLHLLIHEQPHGDRKARGELNVLKKQLLAPMRVKIITYDPKSEADGEREDGSEADDDETKADYEDDDMAADYDDREEVDVDEGDGGGGEMEEEEEEEEEANGHPTGGRGKELWSLNRPKSAVGDDWAEDDDPLAGADVEDRAPAPVKPAKQNPVVLNVDDDSEDELMPWKG
jgi:hypothetical protein